MGSGESLKRLISHIQGKVSSKEDLIEIIRKATEGNIIPEHTGIMIERILEIADKDVEEVMVPRVDMIVVKDDVSLRDAIKIYKKWGYSKLPVVHERIDNVVGVLYIKELLKYLDKIETMKVKDLAIKPYFIPYSKNVLDALKDMQAKRISIALVVDEFGSVAGLVTLEDLLEEIVGEIWEEFDREEVLVEKQEDGSFVFNAKIELDEASRVLEEELSSEEVNTLGGFIIEHLERVPQKGEKFEIEGLEFEILDATQQRLKKIRVKKMRSKE